MCGEEQDTPKSKHSHTHTHTHTHTQSILPQPKIWMKFTFHSPAIFKVTNLFKNTNLLPIYYYYYYLLPSTNWFEDINYFK
jgi:hypothetical protein